MVGPLKVVDVAGIFDLALPFVVISYSWKIVGDLHPSNTPTIQESKNKIKVLFFLILFKTPQPPPWCTKTTRRPLQHVYQNNIVLYIYWLCCFDDIFKSFKPSPSFSHLLDLRVICQNIQDILLQHSKWIIGMTDTSNPQFLITK